MWLTSILYHNIISLKHDNIPIEYPCKRSKIPEFIKENIYFLVDVSKMLFQFPGILRKLEIKKLEINEFDLIYLLIFPTIIIEEKGFYAYYELKQSPEVHQKSSNRKIKAIK